MATPPVFSVISSNAPRSTTGSSPVSMDTIGINRANAVTRKAVLQHNTALARSHAHGLSDAIVCVQE